MQRMQLLLLLEKLRNGFATSGMGVINHARVACKAMENKKVQILY